MQMKFSEAIMIVNRFYSPGVRAYYAKQAIDEWQLIHDQLEKAIAMKDPELEATVCRGFVDRAKDLIKKFLATDQAAKITPPECFYSATPNQHQAAMSRRTKRCVKCDGKENLRIRTIQGTLETEIICSICERGKK
jgi:hypothetical protein